ncbi:MAG TPA: PIN domain-containing protein [Candidatus Hydrogenedentes bacterium]|nr:PIN domain-containing protein [Candidatus Hydrogenedentota bacterium]HPG68431.1 PIN domain-containing protein [Candidatus Hydrogenedentota bacterium]
MLVYVDTSVFGGVFDPEFERGSQALFQKIRDGQLRGAVSALVADELVRAPARVSGLFTELEPLLLRLDIGRPAYALRRAYLDARVVGPRWAADALHVASATVGGCRAIVSWNFRHIVHFQRIPLYNAVNEIHGYNPIRIYTPLEMAFDEDEEEEL